MMRIAIAAVLLAASASLTFTQLGFAGVTLPDGTAAYVVVLLPTIGLGALLLGTLAGAVLGALSGAVLLAHAHFLPLNYYELTFVTPLTSVFMLALVGLLAGVFFAYTLQKNPSRVGRVILIFIVSMVVSWAYSLGFSFSVFAALVANLIQTVGMDVSETYVRQVAGMTAVQLGDINVQALATGLLMALVCIAADLIVRKASAKTGTMGLRTVFTNWLVVAATLAVMFIVATSFAISTQDQINDAERLLAGEADYLCNQIYESNLRSKAMAKLIEDGSIDPTDLDDTAFENVINVVAADRLLSGYDKEENGSAVIIQGEVITMSNDENFPVIEPFKEVMNQDMIDAIERSVETGTIQRFVYDGSTTLLSDSRKREEERYVKPYLAYLLAKSIAIDYGDNEFSEHTVVLIQGTDLVFKKRLSLVLWTLLSAFVVMTAVSGIVFLLLSRFVAQRIDEENAALGRITDGDLDVRATAGGTKEFESLTEGINDTVGALKGWIAEAETRMDAELATAKAIQEASIPRAFPPYPDILKFDIYASMAPARQVGGDFYDFFFVGDDCNTETGKLGFVVADVSGKGVPAALFMMKAKALIQDYVDSGMELGEAVSDANWQISLGNDAGMFVTAWIGVLDYATGHVDYVNAGHNPPLLWSHDNGWQWMRKKSGVPLGLFDLPYTAYSVDCQVGDTFMLYSDGVTEAFNVSGEAYGEQRLMDLVQKCTRLHPRQLLEAVREDVASFTEGAEQSDDITILTLEVGVPPEVTSTLEVPAKADELQGVLDFLHAELGQRLCPKRVQNQLDIVIEELFVNVCSYAYPDATPEEPGMVRVQRTYSAGPSSITVSILDDGIAFDPLSAPAATAPSSIESVSGEGLGLLLIRNLVNEIHYERVGETNSVTVVKCW